MKVTWTPLKHLSGLRKFWTYIFPLYWSTADFNFNDFNFIYVVIKQIISSISSFLGNLKCDCVFLFVCGETCHVAGKSDYVQTILTI